VHLISPGRWKWLLSHAQSSCITGMSILLPV
jgi:hypothetical protein